MVEAVAVAVTVVAAVERAVPASMVAASHPPPGIQLKKESIREPCFAAIKLVGLESLRF